MKSELPSALKPSTPRPAVPATRKDGGATGNLVLATPDAERKPGRVQMRGHHDSAESSMPSEAQGTTRDQGVDPMSTIYLDSSVEFDLSSYQGNPRFSNRGSSVHNSPHFDVGTRLLILHSRLVS